MKNADMPAMPQDEALWVQQHGLCCTLGTGLTKREMFAMHAMQGLLANSTEWTGVHYELSREAVDIADAILAQLEESGDDNCSDND